MEEAMELDRPLKISTRWPVHMTVAELSGGTDKISVLPILPIF